MKQMKMHKPEKIEGFENGEFESVENHYNKKVKSNRIEKDLFVEFPVKSYNGWISVKDRLPDLHPDNFSTHVLCFTNTGLIEKGYLDGNSWERCDSVKSFLEIGYIITHWQPLPNPPNDNIVIEKQKGCNMCGGKLVEIRGKYPKQPNRLICPTCTYERLEQINELSNPDYGKTYKNV